MRTSTDRARALVVAAAVLVTAACGDGGDADGAAIVESDGLAVTDAWTRPTPSGSAEAAVYVTIENRDADADRLVGADSERCMVMTPHLTEIDDRGVASMESADTDQLALATGERLTMEPNGLHLMCLGLAEPLTSGESFDVELRFAEHPPLQVPVAVEQR